MDAQAWGEVIILVASVLVAASASATETAMTSVGRLRVRHLAEEGSRAAAVLERLHRDPNRFLSAVLVVNTVALILASFAATLLSLRLLPPGVGFWGDLVVSLVLSVLLLIFAEVTPKTLAIRNAERLALLTAGPVDALARVLRPVLWFITLVSRAITGGRAARAPYVTEEELMTLLHVSEEQGVIEEEEREMIHGIIQIGDKSVREVMVPRTDIQAIPRGASLEEIIQVYRRYRHTRMPVYEGDLDHIVGLLHIKDLLLPLAQGARDFELTQVMRPIRYTPESKKVDELLHLMQTEKVHMMIVMDEYGGTAGLVTLEDLLEEIVGEIRDEYDVEEEPVQILSDREAVVDARYPMAELNQRLELGVEASEDYDSVGGFVYATLGEVPEAGDSFRSGEVQWTVERVEGRRITKVRLRSERPWPQAVLQEVGLAPPEVQAPGPEQSRATRGREDGR
ncbi:MAG TPA: hemolysin family protein [Candidatus Dormibacteraeota bacterium]|nr:hemolysin family protein [Candidatus Dormibacteraeota bacterium]